MRRPFAVYSISIHTTLSGIIGNLLEVATVEAVWKVLFGLIASLPRLGIYIRSHRTWVVLWSFRDNGSLSCPVAMLGSPCIQQSGLETCTVSSHRHLHQSPIVVSSNIFTNQSSLMGCNTIIGKHILPPPWPFSASHLTSLFLFS